MDVSNEPSLPSAWIERLFSRFQAAYGNRLQTMWKDADPIEVRALWAEELARYDAQDIKAALEALRFAHTDYPPTLYEFSSLCRDAATRRKQTVVSLPNKVRNQIPAEVKAKLDSFLRKRVVTP